MPRARNAPKTEKLNPDYVRMYYEHQYDRINKHQEQSLNISNIVLTISALVITFGFSNKQSFGSILVLSLPLTIIIVNLFAVLFVKYGGKWVLQHQSRAKRILEIYVPEIFELDREIAAPTTSWTINRQTIQNMMHYLFVLIGVILFILFLLDAMGVTII